MTTDPTEGRPAVPSYFDDLRATTLRHLARALAPYLPPRRPRPVVAHLLREDADMLVYGLTLPAPGAPDVVKRLLTVTVNGTAQPEFEVTDGHELKVHDNDHVSLVLVDQDDAGNRSEPSPAFEFDAKDTIPPPAPGQVAVALLREEADPPAA